jgi:hypothetical protein
MTLVDDHLLTDVMQLHAGQEILTRTHQAEITSTITSWKKRN